jgi:1,4-dihydroxy-6-naphthoate synthase
MLFSAIIPALVRGSAQRGVCIHEARFTYAQHGLRVVEDLGQRWEQATGLPLPLGGVLVRDTAAPHAADLADAIRASIRHARSDPAGALATMRAYAQEPSDAVLQQHVELYVTAETERLSSEGRRALAELARRACAAGLVERDAPLAVLGD